VRETGETEDVEVGVMLLQPESRSIGKDR